jgi:predicted ATPase
MRELPSGTVTFLFTDIEGSTRLLHELGEGYARALAQHRRMLREACRAHGGVEVDTQGDAFFYAFASAPEALDAAAAAQAGFGAGPVQVRMGVHTGTPELTDEGYVGLDVHLGARIAAAGHGGQVLLSDAARELVDAEVSDLGEHRLKDFVEPVWIFQLGQERHPPLKTISNTNLPRPASAFIGRERERAEVVSLLRDGARLLTLTGTGGSGKTRLAIEAAAELVPEVKNGVFWVGLAALRDPGLVVVTVAQELGAKTGLAQHIGDRELLLLLDNLEQVVASAPELASLVEACPNLQLLVTSRELLRVRGEVEYAVLPLADPDAVELFCSRAVLAPDDAVEGLCRRLDNLPLAIELAAARASVLSPRQLLERISQRLDLLRGGRDAEARQQTLRATIAWSYDLLAEDEQRVFARLAVFAGSFDLEAAEHVCDANVDTLQALVDRSLLRVTRERRFFFLETIRQYAAEARAGEPRRHLAYFAEAAELLAPRLRALSDSAVLGEIAQDLPNFRTAFATATELPDDARAFGIGHALCVYFIVRGPRAEGLAWLEHGLQTGAGDIVARASAARYASELCRYEGRLDDAAEYARRSASLFREAADLAGEAVALREQGVVAHVQGAHGEAQAYLARAGELYREADDTDGHLTVRTFLAALLLDTGDFAGAANEVQSALELAGEDGEDSLSLLGPMVLGTSLANLALAEIRLQRSHSARENLLSALDIALGLGNTYLVASCLEIAAALPRRPVDAAALLGAADALRAEADEPRTGAELALVHDTAKALRDQLGDRGYDREHHRGANLSEDEAAALARSVD